MEFEEILNEVGGYGKYQKHLKAFFLMPVALVIPWLSLDLIFIMSVPDHWCYVKEVAISNLSILQQRALVSPLDNPSCTMYNTSYAQYFETENFTQFSDFVTIHCSEGWRFDTENYDSTASTRWNLVCSQQHLPSLILTLQNVGSLVFTPFFGFLSDRYGRKSVFLLSAFVCATTGLASVLVDDFVTFAILRTLNGGVLSTIFTQPYLLLQEVVPPELRGHMNGIINIFWTLGTCILPLIAYLTRDWITLGIVNSAAAFSMLLYWRFISESPSWLVSQDKYTEALDIMMRIGKKNGKIPDKVHLMKQLQNLAESIKKKKEDEKKISRFPLFKYRRLRRNFLILAAIWSALNVAYYGLMYNVKNMDGNEFINFFLLSVVEIPGDFVFLFLMDYVGRRWTSALGLILLAFVCLLPSTGFPFSDVVSAMFGKFIIAGMYILKDQQYAELFPTGIRALCIGVGRTISGTTTFLVPYLPDLNVYGKDIPFLVIGLVCFIAGLLASFLPETLNKNLPQTISDAERFGKNEKYSSWARLQRIPALEESPADELSISCLSPKDDGDEKTVAGNC